MIVATAARPERIGPAGRGQAGIPPGWPDDAVEVGRVLGAWGVKGGLKVKPFSSDPQAMFAADQWFLKPGELLRPVGAAAGMALPGVVTIINAKAQGDAVVATVNEINDRDAAQALAGARIFVSRAHFPAPDAQEFYWIDLIGLAVANRDGLALGEVVGLIETGPHCVLRVQSSDAEAAEHLIPFVDAYVDKVDMPARRICVDWNADY